MASKVLKCDKCDIVINEVLAFVQNKANIMNKDNLVQICVTGFSAEDIKEAKILLFDSVPDATLKVRKNKGKSVRDIEDIVSLIKGVDDELLPIFVARDLNKLPPVCFDHVDPTRLLKDILILQNEVHQFKTQYVTKEDLRVVQNELENLKRASIVNDFDYVNTRRGAHVMNSFTCNSGPMGLNLVSLETSHQNNTKNSLNSPTHIKSPNSINQQCVLKQNAKNDCECLYNNNQIALELDKSINTERKTIVNKQISHTAVGEPVTDDAQLQVQCTAPTTSALVTELGGSECNGRVLYSKAVGREPSEFLENTQCTQTVGDSKWMIVRGKKTRRKISNFVGKLGKADTDPSCKFKSIDVKVPLYISNVCKNTNENDIIDYVKEKIGETVVMYKINQHSGRRYDSYKLYVSKSKMDTLLDDSFWPNGISYRRFAKRVQKDISNPTSVDSKGIITN